MNLINLIYSFLNTLISNIFFIDENNDDLSKEEIKKKISKYFEK